MTLACTLHLRRVESLTFSPARRLISVKSCSIRAHAIGCRLICIRARARHSSHLCNNNNRRDCVLTSINARQCKTLEAEIRSSSSGRPDSGKETDHAQRRRHQDNRPISSARCVTRWTGCSSASSKAGHAGLPHWRGPPVAVRRTLEPSVHRGVGLCRERGLGGPQVDQGRRQSARRLNLVDRHPCDRTNACAYRPHS